MNEKVTEVEKYIEKIIDFGFEFGPRLIGAVIVLIIGLWITKMITQGTGKMLDKRKIDPSLVPFLKSLTSTILKILVIITVLGMVGVQMTSFIAILGAAALAIGMALSGTLQNFSGGVIIMIFKPFKVGDFIEAQGFLGTVKEISIFTTILNTVDNKVIILPNGSLSNSALTNFSIEPQRRVDWKFGIAYGDSMEDFKKAINVFMMEDTRILKQRASFIGLAELGDSSVNFAVRAWVNTADYWDVFFEMNEKVYKRFGDYNLNIPFPQMDIYIQKEK